MSSIILGRYPHLADGAVLASTIYNVHKWAKKHKWESYPNSLSPSDFVKTIPKNDFVYIVSGTKDTDTYPEMSLKYYKALLKRGVKTKFLRVKGGTNNSVVIRDAAIFDKTINMAISACDR